MAFLSYCTTCYTFAKHSVIPKANISPTISFIEVFTAYFTAPVSNRMTSVTLSSPPCIPHNSEFHWQKKVVRKLLCHVIFLSYKRCYLRISAMRFLDGLTLVTPRKDVLWVVFGLNYILMKVLIFWVSWLAEYTGADWVVGVSKRTRTQDKTPSVVPVLQSAQSRDAERVTLYHTHFQSQQLQASSSSYSSGSRGSERVNDGDWGPGMVKSRFRCLWLDS